MYSTRLYGYIRKIRSKIGSDRFLYPAARVIIENGKGEYLFIERVDNGNIGLPAGGMEEGESIEECIIREAKEETGLDIKEVQVIGISSNPKLELVKYPNGDETQYFTIEFYTNNYDGELIADGIESKSVSFKSSEYINLLPDNEKSTFESLIYYQKHSKIKVK